MKNHRSIAALAMMLALPSGLLAHGGHKHKTIMGTVNSVNTSRVEVTTTDGQKVLVPVVKTTTYLRGDKKASADQVHVGTRVVILLGEDDKTAQQIKIGITAKTR